MTICKTCVLPESFPSIAFDSDGICNYCRSFQKEKDHEGVRDRYREKFESLLKKQRGARDYDVLMAYSGGKDSSYTLDIFKNHFGLRILALSFDHGFLSPFAMQNIKTVVERLGIDHIFFKPNFELMKRLFVVSISENLYTKKALERASTICSSCMNMVKFITLKMALEKEIPYIGYGWSPGQAPVQSAVMRTSVPFTKATQKVLFEPLYAKFGDEVKPYFLSEEMFRDGEKFPYNVHPLAFLEYDEGKIYKRIKELGWEPPTDTDPNSTNCLMNAFANKVHIEQCGFHPYAFEVAGLVRMGVMSREEGLSRLNKSGDEKIIDAVRTKLGLS
ncbi:MAG TPA: phosphoadenosine phosphosulfate reductase family protein [Syntrophales bacterium]|jgi:tRNA(Ile)-lysidine synthase TilS/MesJ|nr:phosphoadenosine phosphosulfate reductase family protein [Syntrophales bacterium]